MYRHRAGIAGGPVLELAALAGLAAVGPLRSVARLWM